MLSQIIFNHIRLKNDQSSFKIQFYCSNYVFKNTIMFEIMQNVTTILYRIYYHVLTTKFTYIFLFFANFYMFYVSIIINLFSLHRFYFFFLLPMTTIIYAIKMKIMSRSIFVKTTIFSHGNQRALKNSKNFSWIIYESKMHTWFSKFPNIYIFLQILSQTFCSIKQIIHP